jgi:hypothetical protein
VQQTTVGLLLQSQQRLQVLSKAAAAFDCLPPVDLWAGI